MCPRLRHEGRWIVFGTIEIQGSIRWRVIHVSDPRISSLLTSRARSEIRLAIKHIRHSRVKTLSLMHLDFNYPVLDWQSNLDINIYNITWDNPIFFVIFDLYNLYDLCTRVKTNRVNIQNPLAPIKIHRVAKRGKTLYSRVSIDILQRGGEKFDAILWDEACIPRKFSEATYYADEKFRPCARSDSLIPASNYSKGTS